MKISEDLKYTIFKLADTASLCRYLNQEITRMCEYEGINTEDPDFIAAFAFVEGDCDTTQIFNYLENL